MGRLNVIRNQEINRCHCCLVPDEWCCTGLFVMKVWAKGQEPWRCYSVLLLLDDDVSMRLISMNKHEQQTFSNWGMPETKNYSGRCYCCFAPVLKKNNVRGMIYNEVQTRTLFKKD